METTKSLGIPLPSGDDVVDIEDIKQGMRMLEEAIVNSGVKIGAFGELQTVNEMSKVPSNEALGKVVHRYD